MSTFHCSQYKVGGASCGLNIRDTDRVSELGKWMEQNPFPVPWLKRPSLIFQVTFFDLVILYVSKSCERSVWKLVPALCEKILHRFISQVIEYYPVATFYFTIVFITGTKLQLCNINSHSQDKKSQLSCNCKIKNWNYEKVACDCDIKSHLCDYLAVTR